MDFEFLDKIARNLLFFAQNLRTYAQIVWGLNKRI